MQQLANLTLKNIKDIAALQAACVQTMVFSSETDLGKKMADKTKSCIAGFMEAQKKAKGPDRDALLSPHVWVWIGMWQVASECCETNRRDKVAQELSRALAECDDLIKAAAQVRKEEYGIKEELAVCVSIVEKVSHFKILKCFDKGRIKLEARAEEGESLKVIKLVFRLLEQQCGGNRKYGTAPRGPLERLVAQFSNQ